MNNMQEDQNQPQGPSEQYNSQIRFKFNKEVNQMR